MSLHYRRGLSEAIFKKIKEIWMDHILSSSISPKKDPMVNPLSKMCAEEEQDR